MAERIEQVVEELLSKIEAGQDISPKSAGLLASRASIVELSCQPTGGAEQFHRRVQSALQQLDAEAYLDGRVDYALTLFDGGRLIYEEYLKLASIFESIGALMHFDIQMDEARRMELLDATDEFLAQRRPRGEFKEAFLDMYRNEIARLNKLSVASTLIDMMNLKHMLET